MEIGKKLYITERKDFRKWLHEYHDKESEIWLVLYRKSSEKKGIDYNDAVEEALCFGWIDSLEKRIDDEKYALRFSPRKKNSNLSPSNNERVKKLIAQKKMTKVGLEAIAHAYDPNN